MKLILVRHGETSWNKEAKLLSKTDIELNNVGIEQAKLVSKKLKNKKFDLIFSSSKKRALKTAEIINENHNVKIKITELLNERDFGDLEGTNYHELNLTKIRDDNSYAEHNMESPKDFENRIKKILEEYCCKEFGKTVLIVSHSGTIKMLIYHLLKIKESFEIFRKENVKPNASISTIEFDENFNVVNFEIGNNEHLI